MLQQGFTAGGNRRDDLHVRVHVLSRLRRKQARRTLPQLRRQSRIASVSSAFEAGEQSGLDGACVQAGGLRPRCRAKLSDWISREVPFAFPRSGCHFGTELGTPKPAVFALDAATSVRRSSLFDPMMRTSFASTSTRRASAEMIATVAAALGPHVGPSITPQALKRFTRRARKRIWRRTAQERRGADRRPREGKIKGAMCARSDDGRKQDSSGTRREVCSRTAACEFRQGTERATLSAPRATPAAD